MGKGNKGSGGGGGGAGPSNGAGPGKGGGGGGGGGGFKPGKPGKRRSSGMDARYLYAACALAIGAAAIGFQQFAATSSPQEPPKVQEAPRSQKRAGTVPAETTPPRRKAPVEAKAAARRVDPTCVDDHENCAYWAKSGECDNNAAFMKASCKASCGVCNGGKPPPKKRGACQDTNDNCATWAAIGECQSNPGFMLTNCPVTCKMCQSETCKDDLPDCAERCRGPATSNFSDSFYCYSSPELTRKCAWTCGACKEHRFDRPECKRRAGVQPAAKPGSVNEIFLRIVREWGERVTVHSAPTGIGAPQGGAGSQRPPGDPDGPWLLTIDDFLTSEESDEVIRAGSQGGKVWQRSMAGDGVQASRTSSTAWCGGVCAQNPTIAAVEERVARMMGIPMENAEPMQVLRHEMQGDLGRSREIWGEIGRHE